MFYQLRLNVYSKDLATLQGAINSLKGQADKLEVVNPSTEHQEASTIELLTNHHDTNPSEPCSIISTWTNEPQ